MAYQAATTALLPVLPTPSFYRVACFDMSKSSIFMLKGVTTKGDFTFFFFFFIHFRLKSQHNATLKMADYSSPQQQSQQNADDYIPPPPPPLNNIPPPSSASVGRNRSPSGRDRSLSPSHRSSSNSRYYDERRSYRDDDRYGGGRDRYESYPRRDYYDSRDRYDRGDRYDRYDRYDQRDRYDHRDRYDRYDDRRGGGRYPPKSRPRRPVDRGSEQERKTTTTIYAGNLPYDFIERDVRLLDV